jgi:hypothetical protein
MPRLATNYQNIIIYKIVCCDLIITNSYVGSTTQFTKRKCSHKYMCNNETSKGYNFKLYTFIRDNGGWCNWNMVEIEKFPCQDGNEAYSRERYWIELLKSNLNMKNPINTTDENTEYKKEWYKENKEQISEQHKEWYKENKEQIAEEKKKYRKVNKEKIKEYQKEYQNKNKEKIKEYKKEWYKAK